MCFKEVCYAFIVASQNRIVMRTTLPCSLLALSPEDVLPAVYLCTNKIAADHENMVRFFSSVAFYTMHVFITRQCYYKVQVPYFIHIYVYAYYLTIKLF